MPVLAQDSGNIPRLLLTRSDGALIIDTNDGAYHYVAITDDTTGTAATVWDPAAGKSIHLVSLIVSVSDAGQVEIYDNVAGTEIAVMHFNEKKTVPANFAGDVVLAADNVLGAKFTCDAGSKTAHITAIGHEH